MGDDVECEPDCRGEERGGDHGQEVPDDEQSLLVAPANGKPVAEAAQLGGPDETAVAAESATKALADHVSAGAFDDALNVGPVSRPRRAQARDSIVEADPRVADWAAQAAALTVM
jgi:hypothetical protein